MPEVKKKIIEQLEQTINYRFQNKKLLEQALTHPSLNDHKSDISNERLEFLGDSVLNMIITEALYIKHENELEGALSRKRAYLVSSNGVSMVASNLGLQNFLFLSRGEEKTNGRTNPKNLENALEAIIGAIYLDGGIIEAKNFILSSWRSAIESATDCDIDEKSYLQNWAQKNYGIIPKYILISQRGSKHSPIFEIEVKIENIGSSIGTGKNKKEAEKNAANFFLAKYVVKY
ncbi:MAG: ribonuclease III [Rickettsiaceae bacterium]|nr:ribonuclease III [Rickettsiaceae bacterium]